MVIAFFFFSIIELFSVLACGSYYSRIFLTGLVGFDSLVGTDCFFTGPVFTGEMLRNQNMGARVLLTVSSVTASSDNSF